MATKTILLNFRSAKKRPCHRCFDHRRANCVHPNLALRIFQRSGLRQPDYAMLARAISSCTNCAHQACNGCHIYNRSPAALLEHLPDFVLQAEPDALEIDVDGAIEIFFRLPNDGSPDALDSGVIKSDI